MAADWQAAYQQYQVTGHPDDLHATVKALDPVIHRSVTSLGSGKDPAMLSKARLLAAAAVKTYSPDHGAALPTWVSHQMSPLRRYRRLTGQVLQVPERVTIDAYNISKAKQEFVDKNQREPDQFELADQAKLSMKRLKHVQSRQFVTPGDASMEGGVGGLINQAPDHTEEAMDYVYRDADPVDRAIMEGRMGYNGTKELSTQKILQRTKLSPFQLTRRAGALSLRIQKMLTNLEDASR